MIENLVINRRLRVKKIEPEDNAKTVNEAFKKLADECEYKIDTDCGHTDVDFDCMSCQISICPLLGNWGVR